MIPWKSELMKKLQLIKSSISSKWGDISKQRLPSEIMENVIEEMKKRSWGLISLSKDFYRLDIYYFYGLGNFYFKVLKSNIKGNYNYMVKRRDPSRESVLFKVDKGIASLIMKRITERKLGKMASLPSNLGEQNLSEGSIRNYYYGLPIIDAEIVSNLKDYVYTIFHNNLMIHQTPHKKMWFGTKYFWICKRCEREPRLKWSDPLFSIRDAITSVFGLKDLISEEYAYELSRNPNEFVKFVIEKESELLCK